jgi:hypothetical protein
MGKEFMSWEQVEEGFQDALDCDGAVKVGSLEFYPSNILKNCDPIAYRIGLSEYGDFLAEDYAVEGVNEEEEDDE